MALPCVRVCVVGQDDKVGVISRTFHLLSLTLNLTQRTLVEFCHLCIPNTDPDPDLTLTLSPEFEYLRALFRAQNKP